MGDRLVERTDECVDVIDEALRDGGEGGGLGAGPRPLGGGLLARLGQGDNLPRDRVGGGREHLGMHRVAAWIHRVAACGRGCG